MKSVLVSVALAAAVCLSACSQPSDSTIVSDANEAIADEAVPGSIRVAANSGVVTLTGIVPDVRAKHRAQDIVGDVDGVARVVNNLRTSAGDAPIAPQRSRDGIMNHGAPDAPAPGDPAAPVDPMQRPGGDEMIDPPGPQ